MPHLAFPLAACSTVMLLEQEVKKATVNTTTKERMSVLMVTNLLVKNKVYVNFRVKVQSEEIRILICIYLTITVPKDLKIKKSKNRLRFLLLNIIK